MASVYQVDNGAIRPSGFAKDINLKYPDSAKHLQVGGELEHPPICPLSLWERVRVRGF